MLLFKLFVNNFAIFILHKTYRKINLYFTSKKYHILFLWGFWKIKSDNYVQYYYSKYRDQLLLSVPVDRNVYNQHIISDLLACYWFVRLTVYHGTYIMEQVI